MQWIMYVVFQSCWIWNSFKRKKFSVLFSEKAFHGEAVAEI